MLGLALCLVALASPAVACPPSVGQIRWSGLSYRLRSKPPITVTGSLWDRDRDGRPSANDLLHIESAEPLSVGDDWVVLRGALARDLRRRFKRMRGLTARCESRFKVKGVPRISSPAALVRHLRGLGGAGKMSVADRVRADMQAWASARCKEPKHVPLDELERWLQDRALRRHARHGRGLIRRLAHQVAEEFEVACAHFSVPKLTYD